MNKKIKSYVLLFESSMALSPKLRATCTNNFTSYFDSQKTCFFFWLGEKNHIRIILLLSFLFLLLLIIRLDYSVFVLLRPRGVFLLLWRYYVMIAGLAFNGYDSFFGDLMCPLKSLLFTFNKRKFLLVCL